MESVIVPAILESVRKKISSYPVHSNRASDLGNPCTRYHVYNRTQWEEKALHDVRLEMIFRMGNAIEEITLRDLADAGIKVIEQQRSFEWKEHKITGHIDGLVEVGGVYYPLEIKSCSPFVFDYLTDINSLKNGKYLYLRKYPTQLNLYMLMKGIEKAVFLFKNKSTGAYKEIWMDIDYDLGEETLQRVEAINIHCLLGTLPDKITDDRWCDDCPFCHICLPDREGKEVEIETGELSDLLDRLDSLRDAKKEYEEIDAHIKKLVEGREKILAGSWFVSGSWIEKKESIVKASRYWKRKVEKV